jgi:hypothetical protein
VAAEQQGFGSRGRARRRARFLRRARELAYRDLGGLVFSLHRFGQRNDALVLAKLSTLGHIDSELRAIEATLKERRPVTVLREAGITACPRCAAIHASEDRFCPNCGLAMRRDADLPIAGAPAGTPAPPAVAPLQPTQAPPPVQTPPPGQAAASPAFPPPARPSSAPQTPLPVAQAAAAVPASTSSRAPQPTVGRPKGPLASQAAAEGRSPAPPTRAPQPVPAQPLPEHEQTQQPVEEATEILHPPGS